MTVLVIRGIVTQGWLWYCVLLITLYPHANLITCQRGRLSLPLATLLALCFFLQQALVLAPQVNRRTLISVVAGPVAASDAAPAFTDEIGDAASYLPTRPTHL